MITNPSDADWRSWSVLQFITAAAPNFDAPGTNTNQEAYRLQLKMFLGLVAQQQHLPPLKQLLQLYTVRMRRVSPPNDHCTSIRLRQPQLR